MFLLELTLFFDLRAIKGARIVLVVAAAGDYKPGREEHAPVAQRIARLTTDQKVGGSNPFGRTTDPRFFGTGDFLCLQKYARKVPRRKYLAASAGYNANHRAHDRRRGAQKPQCMEMPI